MLDKEQLQAYEELKTVYGGYEDPHSYEAVRDVCSITLDNADLCNLWIARKKALDILKATLGMEDTNYNRDDILGNVQGAIEALEAINS